MSTETNDKTTGMFAGIRTVRLRLPVSSPACYSPSRRTIYINPPTFDSLSDRTKTFVLCHEVGHATVRDEDLADWEGFLRFIRLGYTPKDAVEAINESLGMMHPEHQERFIALVYRAAKYDAEVNNNPKTLNLIMENPVFEHFTEKDATLLAQRTGLSEDEVMDFLGMSEDEASDFLCMSKEERQAKKQAKKDAKAEKKAKKQEQKERRQEARTQKQEAKAAEKAAKTERKNQKAEARVNLINSRANKNNAKAEGIANGTYQGAGAAIGDALGGVLDTAKSIFGKGGDDDGGYIDPGYGDGGSVETKSATDEGSGKMKWILIAVAAAVVIAVVVVLVVKKKKK